MLFRSTADYADRYFSLILPIFTSKSYEVSSKIIDGLFPSYLISETTLKKTDQWLNTVGKDAHATLRRHVIEAKESMERALRVRSIDR